MEYKKTHLPHHPTGYYPSILSNYTKYFYEIETNGIQFTDRLKVYDIEVLEELKRLIVIVIELNEDKSLTHLYISKIINKEINEENHEG